MTLALQPRNGLVAQRQWAALLCFYNSFRPGDVRAKEIARRLGLSIFAHLQYRDPLLVAAANAVFVALVSTGKYRVVRTNQLRITIPEFDARVQVEHRHLLRCAQKAVKRPRRPVSLTYVAMPRPPGGDQPTAR